MTIIRNNFDTFLQRRILEIIIILGKNKGMMIEYSLYLGGGVVGLKENIFLNNGFLLCSEFGKHAVDLLDLSYKDSALHAIASLDDKLPEFGNKTVTQVAQLCRNKYFIAHKSCQKWMMHRWHGVLRIREVDYRIFKLPEWVKVSNRLISLPVWYKIVS